MRSILLLSSLVIFSIALSAQQYYPIKVNDKWGLMDAEGGIFIEPIYNAVGEFKKYDYAVMPVSYTHLTLPTTPYV